MPGNHDTNISSSLRMPQGTRGHSRIVDNSVDSSITLAIDSSNSIDYCDSRHIPHNHPLSCRSKNHACTNSLNRPSAPIPRIENSLINTKDLAESKKDHDTTNNSMDISNPNTRYTGLWSFVIRPIKDVCMNKPVMITILLGQFMPLMASVSGLCSEIISEWYSRDLIGMQTFLSYFLLMIAYFPFFVFVIISKYRENQSKPLLPMYNIDEKSTIKNNPKDKDISIMMITKIDSLLYFSKFLPLYFITSIIDYEANYLVVKSFERINLLSATLILCLTTPVVMLLSIIIYRVKYRLLHYLGVFVALAGIGLVIGFPVHETLDHFNEYTFTGHLACAGGALLYCASNLLQEYLVKKFGTTPFLSLLGLFCSIIAVVQNIWILKETESFKDFFKFDTLPSIVTLCTVSYAVSLFLFYSISPIFLHRSNATLFNLSLLSSSLYSFMLSLAIFKHELKLIYTGAFAMVIIGVFIFNIVPVKSNQGKEDSIKQ